ncbi:TPA: shikimate kinase [Legionella pneumophila]
MNHPKRIFIIGQPGAGKGLFSKTLADKLGWQFVNTDLELEFRLGRDIGSIFHTEGLDDFLKLQYEIISAQLKKDNTVINTDASIALNPDIQGLLSSEFVVYLDVSTAVQIKRTPRNPDPLLPLVNTEIFLEQLHQERDHLYEKMATVAINTDDNKLDEHVAIILEQCTENIEPATLLINREDRIVFHKTLHIPFDLSEQQARCLKLLAQGLSSKQIARELDISFRTVEGVIAKLTEKLGCSSSKELISLYLDKP